MKTFIPFTFVFLPFFAGCTVDVAVPTPKITISCVVVELPGGAVTTECPDGGEADAAME